MRMFLDWRVKPRPLAAELDRRLAAYTEQQMLGLVAQVHAESELRLDPCQARAVRKAPGVHDLLACVQRRVSDPQPQVGIVGAQSVHPQRADILQRQQAVVSVSTDIACAGLLLNVPRRIGQDSTVRASIGSCLLSTSNSFDFGHTSSFLITGLLKGLRSR